MCLRIVSFATYCKRSANVFKQILEFFFQTPLYLQLKLLFNNMKKILTLTLNPAIDKSTSVERFLPEHKLRCENPRYDAGGGGINVSRAIKELGGKSTAILTAGGHYGILLQELLKAQGVDFQAVKIKEWTRESFIVVETSTNQQFRFGFSGPNISPEEAQIFLEKTEKAAAKADYVVASGSLANGLPIDFYADLAHRIKKAGARFILDTSGEPLKAAANAGVFLLKPNVAELCKLIGAESLEIDQVDDAALEIIGRGDCEVVVVSLGASGAVVATKEGCEHVPAPMVKKLSTVGAGDSMVAGMTWALATGKNYSQMARMGVACGSAATMNVGTTLFKKPDVERLLEWINNYSEKYAVKLA
jgi:6-phosphofructokinase 2